MDGVQDLASYLTGFYDEFNYYWRFFNGFGGDFEGAPYNYDPNDHPDECLYLEELESTIWASYDVTVPEIRDYWQVWYFETYGIEPWAFDICYRGNGEFDFDCYWDIPVDGPAFDGAEWLVLHGDWETGTLKQAFMWFYQNQCYFSMGSPGYHEDGNAGTCTLEGHRTRGSYLQ